MKPTEQVYQHEAMKTAFSLRLRHPDKQLCNSLAQAAITTIDEIEYALSRYIEGSEIWQINHMQSGQTLLLSDLTYQCLQLALEAYVQTGGLFDITLGKQIEHNKRQPENTTPPPLQGQLMLDPERPAIHCIEAGREIDLGGIGKGFALDKIREQIATENIDALICAGASTLLAIGQQSWPIHLRIHQSHKIIDLKNQALSASGTEIQGCHILSPRGTEDDQIHPRIWVTANTAAIADALSTATLLMSTDEIRQISSEQITVYLEKDNAITSIQ